MALKDLINRFRGERTWIPQSRRPLTPAQLCATHREHLASELAEAENDLERIEAAADRKREEIADLHAAWEAFKE